MGPARMSEVDLAGRLLLEVPHMADPLVWQVHERFSNEGAFQEHQERVAASEWDRQTGGIPCDHQVAGPASG